MENKDSNENEKNDLKKKGKIQWSNDTKNNNMNLNNDDKYHKRQKTPVKHKGSNQEDD